MQLDEPGHVGRDVVREAQRPHPGRRQLRADDLVVVEGDSAVRLEPPGLGLAHVVHERGEPQHEVGVGPRPLQVDGLLEHGQGVLVDVLVAMVLVDLEGQPGQLGQDVIGEPGLDQQGETASRLRRAHQLDQLVADALGRHDRDASGHLADRCHDVGVDVETQRTPRTGRRAASAAGRR